jgi:hypothetical protein
VQENKKIGENMNRKIMILMVAVVATVLPAVAVADVMITGNVGVTGTHAKDQFWVQPGSNYAAANTTTGFGWHAKSMSESEILGNITLGYMSNETIYEINVLDINFTAGTGNFNITVNVPSSGNDAFPSGTYMYFSESPFYFDGTSIDSLSAVQTVNLATSGNTLISFLGVTSSTTIYISFSVGSGPTSGYGFGMSMVYSSD